jgi:hypothetical protein
MIYAEGHASGQGPMGGRHEEERRVRCVPRFRVQANPDLVG